jgi:hypothetical protein
MPRKRTNIVETRRYCSNFGSSICEDRMAMGDESEDSIYNDFGDFLHSPAQPAGENSPVSVPVLGVADPEGVSSAESMPFLQASSPPSSAETMPALRGNASEAGGALSSAEEMVCPGSPQIESAATAGKAAWVPGMDCGHWVGA